ncbi:hypothetical protein KBY58_11340 [Cyanobium sp. HWJ4-Hawea]|uniref:hypothetical protein n=1 Tax=Cyanobium sp. HWJ4-Hawea TaxID=2823713 RepID=UPI0020CF83D7|nr:hypothetical protein [Cyanobium sp. HWJ4-Hawea]MCP9810028.1 hypothetical protein [Cyanobium sp. HWJ4-Hawea]
MVSPEDLACLDTMIWLGSGSAAAKFCQTHQSSISRRSRQVCEIFGVSLGRKSGEYFVEGNGIRLLEMQREVHQLHRRLGGSPLRFDGSLLVAAFLNQFSDGGWNKGLFQRISSPFTSALLQDRLIDAWIGPIGDQPDPAADSSIHVNELFETPLCLTVNRDHPLAQQKNICTDDLDPFPRLAPMRSHYPSIDKRLKAMDFPSKPKEQSATKYARLIGRCLQPNNQAVFYGTRLTLHGSSDKVALDIKLPVSLRIGLHVLSPLQDEPAIDILREALINQALLLSGQCPELELSMPMATANVDC